MSSVIDLCSSDEEDVKAVAVQSKAAVRRRRSKPVTPEDRKDGDGNSSSSGSEHRKHKQKKSRQLAFDNDSSDSDDDYLFAPIGCFANKKKEEDTVTPFKENPKAKAAPSLKQPRAITSSLGTTSSASTTAIPKRPPVLNPYAKRPVSKPSKSQEAPLSYPNPSNQTHPDLRPMFILAFWKHAQTMVHASYNLGKMDQICRRICALAFSDFPIRSEEEYCQRFTSTHDAAAIREIFQGCHNKFPTIITPSDGRYVSIPEACLVALLEHAESIAKEENNDNALPSVLSQKQYWISLSNLLPMIDSRLKSICPGRLTQSNQDDNGAAHYLEPSTRSAEFKQIEKLTTKASTGQDVPYMKPHRQKGLVYYELTALGYQMAQTVRHRTFPGPPGHYRTSNLHPEESQKYQGICLAVDNREGGGPKKRLHAMCNKLDWLKTPYFVRSLDIGDYCLFATDTDRLLPVLVERKSVQDVAASIYDGRWTNQKRRMYQGQYVFGYDNCRLVYIIEGNRDAQQLTGGYVGERRFDVTREQLDKEIENLQSEGFKVMITHSPDHSMVELSKWAVDVRQDYASGKLKAKYTYEAFLQAVRKIPRNTDFSRIAKDHAANGLFEQSTTVEAKKPAAQKKFEIKKQSTAVEAKKPAAQRKLNFGSLSSATSPKWNNYNGWTVAKLKAECEKHGLPKTGNKAEIIARLNGPKPPQLWRDRKAQKEYVPTKPDGCANAILVGLLLEQRKAGSNFVGLTKEELHPLAESLEISKDPFSGVPTGPYKYDGWSSMKDLRGGEIPLVILRKGRFVLTTSSDVSGYPFAEAMHQWCHEHGVCKCQSVGYEYEG
ncbi:MUS81 endonuclease homolog (Saccharomyces cerevisiae) [Seminavis robusta]|uniref:Crossover junction endonuclease MUS81 n=1 Tax=Seminavis robusta TaxID=568900 RepID=A0A9N8E496_9STRA|nr:MUS81 endonuclease homolog (Saccharomyces cerevisiae) [Seminavis robusta]|eukprot:Sro508_g156680.1 MUS81 endonuclease homolog (Saccharomyces cerevisiae) (831) ;mRNA; r:15960-18532